MNLSAMLRSAEGLYALDGTKVSSGLALTSEQRLVVTTAGQHSSFYQDADAGFMPVTASKQHRHRDLDDDRGGRSPSPTAGGTPWARSASASSPPVATTHGASRPHGAGAPFTVKGVRVAAGASAP